MRFDAAKFRLHRTGGKVVSRRLSPLYLPGNSSLSSRSRIFTKFPGSSGHASVHTSMMNRRRDIVLFESLGFTNCVRAKYQRMRILDRDFLKFLYCTTMCIGIYIETLKGHSKIVFFFFFIKNEIFNLKNFCDFYDD